jgi:hypothetical protein
MVDRMVGNNFMQIVGEKNGIETKYNTTSTIDMEKQNYWVIPKPFSLGYTVDPTKSYIEDCLIQGNRTDEEYKEYCKRNKLLNYYDKQEDRRLQTIEKFLLQIRK